MRELVASSRDFEFDEAREVELKGISGRQRVYDVAWAPVAAGL